MEWYFAKQGKQEGPVDLATLQGKLQNGEIAPTDLVWKEGMAEWKPAGEVPELAPPAAASSPSITPSGGATPGPVVHQQRAPVTHTATVPNYLVPAILVTILCCWPFGIPAIVFAAKVDGLVSRGEIAEAQHASSQAKMWCWISGGLGLLVNLIAIIYVVAVGAQM